MAAELTNEISRRINLIKHQVLKEYNLRRSTSEASVNEFDHILSKVGNKHETVFIHAGLSDIRRGFNVDPYRFLIEKLDNQFSSIISTAFTDYFKMSGLYHKKYSRPKNGKFAQLFLEDADYRTDDAIKSFLVKGDYRFDDCDHHDSYSKDGCFNKLVDDDILVCNIGTHWLTCSHLHYFESAFDVDYIKEETYEGVLISEDQTKKIKQTVAEYKSIFYSWNKPKLERMMIRNGVLKRHNLNGLLIYFFTLGDMKRVLKKKIEIDPYYLVKL